MGWSQQFIDTLDNGSKQIHYALNFLPPSNDYNLSQGDYVGMNTLVSIGSADVTIDSAQITPQRWSVNLGGFTVTINGDLRPLNGGSSFKRGAVAELIMIRDGIQNRVCIGQLRNITGGRGVWRLDFVDFLTMMQTRLTSKFPEVNFWHNAGKTAQTTASFNFSSSTRLYLDDITIFEKETGQNGMIFVEDATHGDTDYWTWSSKTTTTAPAGYLTIASTGNYPSTAAHDHLHVGDVVTSIARLRGRPDYVFARLVMSTGDGTQGAFDDYPASWGSGINWNPNLFNVLSLNEYYTRNWATATGNHEIELLIAEPSNIATFLDAVLKMGMWPVWRQNELSWRVCQDPNSASYFSVVDHITDRDIVSIDNHELYASSQSAVYERSTIRVYDTVAGDFDNRTRASTIVYSLPADGEIQRDLSLVYRINNPDQKTKADLDNVRLHPWDSLPYEQLDLTVTEKHCLLCAGDIVEITSNYIYGLQSANGQNYSNRRAMVLGVRWNPSQSSVNLSLGILR